jgi:hypothetical protein
MVGVGQRITGARFFELCQRHDVTSPSFFNSLGFLTLHEQDIAGSLFFSGTVV